MKKKLLTLTMILCLVLILLPAAALAASLDPWEDVSKGSITESVNSLVEYDGKLYAGTQGEGVWAFDGNSWDDVSNGLTGTALNANVLAEYDGKLYVGTFGSGVWVLDDTNGQTSASGLSSKTVQALTVFGGKLYAGTWEGLWVFDGTNWAQVNGNLSGEAAKIQELFEYDGKLYAGTNDGVWVLNDTNTWTKIGAPDSFGGKKEAYALAEYNGKLYAGIWQDGVWVFDGVNAWTNVSGNLTGDALNVIALTEYDGKLFVGTAVGVWAFDGGNTWTDVSDPTGLGGGVSGKSIGTLAVHNNGLYAGTGDGYVWRTFTRHTAADIITHPQGASLNVGGSHTMSVVATGTNLRYQWYKNGTIISTGGTSDTYVISNAILSDAGSYSVSVTAVIGDTVTSNPAVVTVAAPTYTLTVTNGSGSGSYTAGQSVSITANPAHSGQVFDRWTTNNGGSFAKANSASTTFTMPANAVTVTAMYRTGGSGYTGNYNSPSMPSNPSNPSGSFLGGISTFEKGSDAVLVFTVQKNFSLFKDVKADGDPLTPDADFKAESGSTKITLYAEYLNTLSVGSHTLVVGFTDGTSATATFTVKDDVTDDVTDDVIDDVIDDDEETPDTGVGIPFEDVKADDWFVNGVMFAYENGMMVGTSTEPMLFSPNATLTRGMVVTVLYRMAGSPDVSALANPFDDVEAGQWYTDAIIWAQANNIVSGYGNNKFGAEDSITREQMAVILYNYEQFSGEVIADIVAEKEFTDNDSISGWATEAVKALVMQGIITGKPGDMFDPQGNATRAEFATVLMRFSEAVK